MIRSNIKIENEMEQTLKTAKKRNYSHNTAQCHALPHIAHILRAVWYKSGDWGAETAGLKKVVLRLCEIVWDYRD